MNKNGYRPIASRLLTAAEQHDLLLSLGDLPEFGRKMLNNQRKYCDASDFSDDSIAIARPHSFRETLPISALTVTVEPGEEEQSTVQDDIRMFVLSFVTFFMGISLFIW